ncbi:hypothetical protein BDZ89DRAFT_1046350 [Hymenopellis radicata]|nr:hypothetical protein BDZ89DRAFT_1046350 [Hymenopellis radicata]
MPGGRPRKLRHAGGRPAVYHTDEARQAARKASRDKWYFNPRVHKRVKKQMRTRYNETRAVQEGRGSPKPAVPTTVMPNADTEQTVIPALKAARKTQQRFNVYVETSDQVFLNRTILLVLENYTPGEASPLLDRIQDELGEMERDVEVNLNEVLNILGAWADEYLEVQGIRDCMKSLLRTIIDIQCSAMEGTLEDAVRRRQFSFLK